MAGQIDPTMAHFIQTETQKQQVAELMHGMTEQCWDTCMGYPGQKLDRKTETCFSNCVERLMDTSKFIMGRIGQASSMKSGGGMAAGSAIPSGPVAGSSGGGFSWQ